MAVHSGTVPVERMWSSYKDMMPLATRVRSVAWFNLLSKVAFLRYNYRHFHAKRLPKWSDRDALLAERLETLSEIVKLMADADTCDGSTPPLDELFSCFRC